MSEEPGQALGGHTVAEGAGAGELGGGALSSPYRRFNPCGSVGDGAGGVGRGGG